MQCKIEHYVNNANYLSSLDKLAVFISLRRLREPYDIKLLLKVYSGSARNLLMGGGGDCTLNCKGPSVIPENVWLFNRTGFLNKF